MEPILTDTSPAALVRAIDDAFVNYTLACVRTAGGQVHQDPTMTWVYGTNQLAYFNGVFRTDLAPEDAPAAIAAKHRFFAERYHRMSWWVTPTSRPANLADLLTAQGMFEAWRDTGMAIDLAATPPDVPPLAPGVTVGPVRDAAEFEEWIMVFGEGFGLNASVTASYGSMLCSVPFGTHPVGPFFLGRLEGAPVATCVLFITAGVAGIYEVCTVPQARGRGIASALVLAALREGMARGCRIGVIHASEMGEPVYRRLGFQPYCTLAAYLRAGD